MPVATYTRRRIADIKDSENSIDQEYKTRLFAMRTKSDLVDLLTDYEELVPKALQKFRDASDAELEKLQKRIQHFFWQCKNNRPPAVPDEAVMLCCPPILDLVRMWATQTKKTWGKAFIDLSATGAITKLMQRQESMYLEAVKVEKAGIVDNSTRTHQETKIVELK